MNLDVTLHFSSEDRALLTALRRDIISAVHQTKESIMATLDDISAAVDVLKVDFEAYKSGVDAAIADALSKASAAQAPAIQALADKVAAVDAEIKGSGAVATAPPAVAAVASAPADTPAETPTP